MTFETLFILLTYFLMGAKNGFYYANKLQLNFLTILFLLVLLAIYSIITLAYWAFISVAICLIWQTFIFQSHDNKQIHLSEYALSFSIRFLFFMGGMDLYLLILSSLLADTMFKIPINLAVGRNWIEQVDGTDDNSGKSVGTYFLGKFYAVPRLFSNGFTKLYVGLFIFFVWLVFNELGFEFNINDLKELLK